MRHSLFKPDIDANRWLVGCAALFILSCHAGMLAWSAWLHSPVMSEVGHLPAGLSHWEFGRFDLYRVNPPLPRMIAALPVLAVSPTTDWKYYSLDPLVRSETAVGIDFVNANSGRSFWFYTLGRWACIPFSLLGAVICFAWSARLYGAAAGILALVLWCICPSVLGNAPLIMPDVPAAALAAAAAFALWRWLTHPSWRDTFLAGIVLGLAELTKTTFVVFFVLWPVIWFFYRLLGRVKMRTSDWFREGGMLAVCLALSVNVINLGYGYEGAFQRLVDYRFQSQMLSGIEPHGESSAAAGNRFTDTWLGALPVPLPRNYLQGIDTQKLDFERGMKSYLHGEWADRGWWYFYLVAMGIKLPLGTLVLVIVAAAVSLWDPRYSARWRDEMVVLLPAIVVLVLVSVHTGFSIHSRYVLPVLPFVFVWTSKVGRSTVIRNRTLSTVVALAAIWSVGSSLWVYPNSLSYFNELVGGPRFGHDYLLDSNIAWGQDLLALKRWMDEHPQARPMHLATVGFVDPRLAGIDFSLPRPGPRWPGNRLPGSRTAADALGPQPGWYAIDVNHLHRTWLHAPDGSGGFKAFDEDDTDLSYFRLFQPVAIVGWSTYVYDITRDEANAVRGQLGMKKLEAIDRTDLKP